LGWNYGFRAHISARRGLRLIPQLTRHRELLGVSVNGKLANDFALNTLGRIILLFVIIHAVVAFFGAQLPLLMLSTVRRPVT
jgi:hypothetical protein